MNFPFKTTGVIRYDPYRGTMKRKTKGWCVLDVDREITRYCRYLIQSHYHLSIIPPSWDAHVSIFRGEDYSRVEHLWKKYNGKKIEVSYNTIIKQTNNYPYSFFYVDVLSDFINDMRDEMGFNTGWSHHLTIGKLPETWDRRLYINDKGMRV